MLSPSDIRPAAQTILQSADTALTSYEILERLPVDLRDQLVAERGLPGAGSGRNFSAASLVTQAVDKLLPSKEPPYRVYENFTGKTFTVAGHTITPSGSAIATYRLPARTETVPPADPAPVNPAITVEIGVPVGDTAEDFYASVDPAEYSEETLSPPGHREDPDNPYVLVVSMVDTTPHAKPDGGEAVSFAPLTVTTGDGHTFWVAFTSREAMRLALGNGPNNRQRTELSVLVDLFIQMREAGLDEIKGIFLDPSGPEPHVLSIDDMERCLKHPLNDARAQEIYPGTRLPAHSAPTDTAGSTIVAGPARESGGATPEGEPLVQPVPMTLNGGNYLAVFTSHKTLRRGTVDLPFRLREVPLGRLCAVYFALREKADLAGIVLDPFEPTERYLTPEEMKQWAQMTVETTATSASDILDIASPRTLVSAEALFAVSDVLAKEPVEEAWGLAYTYTDRKQSLIIYVQPLSEATAGPLWHRLDEVLRRHMPSGQPVVDMALSPLEGNIKSLLTERGEKLLPVPRSSWKQRLGLSR